MKDYTAKVVVTVRLTAPDESDAKELLEDTFGVGEECGVTVLTAEVTKLKEA